MGSPAPHYQDPLQSSLRTTLTHQTHQDPPTPPIDFLKHPPTPEAFLLLKAVTLAPLARTQSRGPRLPDLPHRVPIVFLPRVFPPQPFSQLFQRFYLQW